MTKWHFSQSQCHDSQLEWNLTHGRARMHTRRTLTHTHTPTTRSKDPAHDSAFFFSLREAFQVACGHATGPGFAFFSFFKRAWSAATMIFSIRQAKPHRPCPWGGGLLHVGAVVDARVASFSKDPPCGRSASCRCFSVEVHTVAPPGSCCTENQHKKWAMVTFLRKRNVLTTKLAGPYVAGIARWRPLVCVSFR